MRNLIEYHDTYIKKYFVGADDEEKRQIKDIYHRELNAYQKFAELNADFVPELLEHDDERLILTIERINGLNLVSLLDQDYNEACHKIDMELIIDQLIEIDSFLYDHRINVLQTSPKDIIYDPHKKKVFITDFEFTLINSSYKQILYDRLFQNKLKRINHVQLRDMFWSELKKRKKEFKLYYYRKIKNYTIKRFRLFFPLPGKKKYLNSKIHVLY